MWFDGLNMSEMHQISPRSFKFQCFSGSQFTVRQSALYRRYLPKRCTSNRHACHRCSLCQLLWSQSIHQVQLKIFNWAAICRSNLKTLMNTRKASISQLLPRRLLPFLGVAGRLKIHHILYGSTILVAGDHSRLQNIQGAMAAMGHYVTIRGSHKLHIMGHLTYYLNLSIVVTSAVAQIWWSQPNTIEIDFSQRFNLLAAWTTEGELPKINHNMKGCYRLFLFSRMKMARGCKGAK